MRLLNKELPDAKAGLTLYGPMGEAIMRANAKRLDEERRVDEGGSNSDEEEDVREVEKEYGGYAKYGGLHGPIHLAWTREVVGEVTEQESVGPRGDGASSERQGLERGRAIAPKESMHERRGSTAALAITFRPIEALNVTTDTASVRQVCSSSSSSSADCSMDPLLASLPSQLPHARLRTFLRESTFEEVQRREKTKRKAEPSNGPTSSASTRLTLAAPFPAHGGFSANDAETPSAVISFTDEEYDLLRLGDDRLQPVILQSRIEELGSALAPLLFSFSLSISSRHLRDVSFYFTKRDTCSLFALCETFGSGNMSAIADRLWPSFSSNNCDGGNQAAPIVFVHACNYRYYSVARALLRGRLAMLEAAARGGEEEKVDTNSFHGRSDEGRQDTSIIPPSSSSPVNKDVHSAAGDGQQLQQQSSSVVQGAISLLLSALEQHPLLAPLLTTSGGPSSVGKGGAATTSNNTSNATNNNSFLSISNSGSGSYYYCENYEAALLFESKQAQASLIEPLIDYSAHPQRGAAAAMGMMMSPSSPLSSQHTPAAVIGNTTTNQKTTTVMQLKARRMYANLAAAVAACKKRVDEDPTMPFFIAAMEDRATAQYERVLEGVREGVYATTTTGSSSSSTSTNNTLLSPSPYAVGAPDLATAEHMLLTMNTKNAKAGGDKVGSGAVAASGTSNASVPSSSAGAAAVIGKKRSREESPEGSHLPSNYTEFLSLLLSKQLSTSSSSPSASASCATTTQQSPLALLPPPPQHAVPTMLHLELEDRLEEVLLADPLALGCACGACRAAMEVLKARLMRCVLIRRALSRSNVTMAMVQKLCLDELAPVLGAAKIETAVVERDTSAASTSTTAAAAAATGATGPTNE